MHTHTHTHTHARTHTHTLTTSPPEQDAVGHELDGGVVPHALVVANLRPGGRGASERVGAQAAAISPAATLTKTSCSRGSSRGSSSRGGPPGTPPPPPACRPARRRRAARWTRRPRGAAASPPPPPRAPGTGGSRSRPRTGTEEPAGKVAVRRYTAQRVSGRAGRQPARRWGVGTTRHARPPHGPVHMPGLLPPRCRCWQAWRRRPCLRGLAAARLSAQHHHIALADRLHHLLLHPQDGQPLPAAWSGRAEGRGGQLGTTEEQARKRLSAIGSNQNGRQRGASCIPRAAEDSASA
jgi:hypothetical protein